MRGGGMANMHLLRTDASAKLWNEFAPWQNKAMVLSSVACLVTALFFGVVGTFLSFYCKDVRFSYLMLAGAVPCGIGSIILQLKKLRSGFPENLDDQAVRDKCLRFLTKCSFEELFNQYHHKNGGIALFVNTGFLTIEQGNTLKQMFGDYARYQKEMSKNKSNQANELSKKIDKLNSQWCDNLRVTIIQQLTS